MTSPSKITNVLIRRNAPNDSCRNLTALMSRCTKTSFIITPHYICAHRNSDNVHNAAFIRYSAVNGNGGRAHFGGLTPRDVTREWARFLHAAVFRLVRILAIRNRFE